MNRSIVRSLGLLTLLGVAACGDDLPTTSGDPLTEAEVESLTGILMQSAFQTPALSAAMVDGPAAAPIAVSEAVQFNAPCSGGGSVSVAGNLNGTVDDETYAMNLSYSVTQTHSDCTETGENEQVFTLDGSTVLAFTLQATYQGDQASFDWDGTLTGSVDWISGDKSGTCGISMTYSASYTGQSITATTGGTVCGVSVVHEYTYGLETVT